MEFLAHFLSSAGSTLITLCWILMLIDCITNKSIQGSRKVWWILLIFFTQIIGAIIYFALGNSYLPALIFKRARQWFQSQSTLPFYTPKPYQPQPYQSLQQDDQYYHGYQQGYQAQTTAQSSPPATYTPYDVEYEQPQASYPELPPQQQ
jgi:hypothetical protein